MSSAVSVVVVVAGTVEVGTVEVDELVVVGVPLMAPVEVEKERPVGNVGEIDH